MLKDHSVSRPDLTEYHRPLSTFAAFYDVSFIILWYVISTHQHTNIWPVQRHQGGRSSVQVYDENIVPDQKVTCLLNMLTRLLFRWWRSTCCVRTPPWPWSSRGSTCRRPRNRDCRSFDLLNHYGWHGAVLGAACSSKGRQLCLMTRYKVENLLKSLTDAANCAGG